MDLVCILGGALSGTWAAKLAIAKGFAVYLTDERPLNNKAELEALGVRVFDGGFHQALIHRGFKWVIKNPGIPDAHPFVQAMANQHRIVNEVEFAQHFVPHWNLIAISGTNGKTTTVEMCGAILKAGTPFGFVGGNVGVPLSEVVYEHPDLEQADGAIEMAGFMLSNTYDFHPRVATLVSLAPDHLDVYPSVEAYYDAKWKVVENLRADDYFIHNLDDATIKVTYRPHQGQVITLSQKEAADVMLVDNQVMMDGVVLFDVRDLQVLGAHNITNAMIAATAATCLGVKPIIIQKALRAFQGVEHRIEYVDTVEGIKFYNDSKATNPESTQVALQAFEKPVILIAGGYDKKISFDILKAEVHRMKALVVFGQTKQLLKASFPMAHVVDDLQAALRLAYDLAQAQDVILFSPACASYDQFTNFEARGRYFKDLVHQLKSNHP